MDAMKHQDKTLGQVGHKPRDAISETESGRQIQRYIRLTNLIPGILQKVDRGELRYFEIYGVLGTFGFIKFRFCSNYSTISNCLICANALKGNLKGKNKGNFLYFLTT